MTTDVHYQIIDQLMKPFFNVSIFSTASWSNPNLWESVFDSLNADLSLKIRSLNRCRRGESSRRLIQSNQEAATLVSELKQGSTELMTDHSYCLVAFGKGISAEVYFPSITQVLDKREYSYDSFRLMISCETAMRPPMSKNLFISFKHLTELLKAFYAEIELDSVIAGEQAPYCRRWNLSYEFPTLSWINYFSNMVVDFFGRLKFDRLPCTVLKWPNGICTRFGNSPDEGDLMRSCKLHAEQILGMDSFTCPVAFPKPLEDFDSYLQGSLRDSFFGKPKLLNGDPKPEFTYVPSFEDLAREFQPSDPPQHSGKRIH